VVNVGHAQSYFLVPMDLGTRSGGKSLGSLLEPGNMEGLSTALINLWLLMLQRGLPRPYVY
jgi:hypothetical protein